MAQDYELRSWIGTRYFLKALGSSAKYDGINVPGTVAEADEIKDVLDCDLGEKTKDIKGYRTLNGNGYESKACLGQSLSDANINLIRPGSGDVYDGTVGSSTYTKLRYWSDESDAQGGIGVPKCIVELINRGTGWEGTCYYCHISKFNGGSKDTDSGMTYSVTVSPFGPPIPLTVTYDSTTDTFTLTKAG